MSNTIDTTKLATIANYYKRSFHNLEKSKLVEIASQFGIYFKEYPNLDKSFHHQLKGEYQQLSKRYLAEMLEDDAEIISFWE